MSRKGRKEACSLLSMVTLQGNFWQFCLFSVALRPTFSACGPEVKPSHTCVWPGITAPLGLLTGPSLLHVLCLVLSAESSALQGSARGHHLPRAARSTEGHHLFRKLRVSWTQLSVVQLGVKRRAETAPEKSRSTEQNPWRPWGPPAACSQLVLLGYLGLLEPRLNWNHWIGSGTKQTDKPKMWQVTEGRQKEKKCRNWKRVAVWHCFV